MKTKLWLKNKAMKKPITTLFMLMSVDGKISTGDNDSMDVDKDFPKIKGVAEGLSQYYELEKWTDLFSMNSGRVFAKIGINEKTDEPPKLPVSFIVVDNEPYLTEKGVTYLAKKSKTLFIATNNKSHPAFEIKKEMPNIEILSYEKEIDFTDLMEKLVNLGVDKLTIQCGGTLNSILIRAGLVDKIQLVVAPALIGGKNTSTIMDGESLHSIDELSKIKSLELIKAEPLKSSYLLLEYKVNN
jgi:2,5-diamino-6-(ribosylamino)-4(3H)-pyrimidinone 5'-phosphate reductase